MSSPNASTFSALVEELASAIYNAVGTSGIEYREFDPEGKMTFWQLAATMVSGRVSGGMRQDRIRHGAAARRGMVLPVAVLTRYCVSPRAD